MFEVVYISLLGERGQYQAVDLYKHFTPLRVKTTLLFALPTLSQSHQSSFRIGTSSSFVPALSSSSKSPIRKKPQDS